MNRVFEIGDWCVRVNFVDTNDGWRVNVLPVVEQGIHLESHQNGTGQVLGEIFCALAEVVQGHKSGRQASVLGLRTFSRKFYPLQKKVGNLY